MLTRVAAVEPDKRIFTFLYSDRDEQTVSAGQLHRDACSIAAFLSEHDVRPREIVPLVFDHSYELVATFWGAIYFGAIPTILPYVSHDTRSKSYLHHVARLVRFTEARTVVTLSNLQPFLDQGLADAPCRILALPSFPLDSPAPDPNVWPTAEALDPPYIQFSSGTTGSPKGVRLSHAMLDHYCRASTMDFAATPDDVTVGWLPLYHDMGLVNQIFEPVFVPHHSVLISPAAWLSDPQRLLHAIHRFRGTITWMPNFAFRYCARRIRDEQIAGIDLSSWRILGNASEPVLHEDLQAFTTRFAAHGLRPEALSVSFGLAEHVAALTWTAHDRAPDVDWVTLEAMADGKARPADPHAVGSRCIVSCGRPIAGATLRIVNDAGGELAEREIGEVVAQSPMVFTGYYLMPEESATALRDGWLHTGDLGYVADGQLYICGRKKDLIIIGGRNIHPNHLEAIAGTVLGEHGRFAAAFGVPNPHLGTEMPILVCEMRQGSDAATRAHLQQMIRDEMRRTLQLFLGDVHIVDPGWIIKTTSGKINRPANRAKYLSERNSLDLNRQPAAEPLAIRTATTPTERRLASIWARLFKRIEINLDDDFFELGGDSLLAARLLIEIEDQFHCSLPSTALLESPTITRLARLLDHPQLPTLRQTLVPIQPVRPPFQRPVFFCVHGLGGGVLDYRPLSHALGPEQPFYALQARGLDGTSPIDTSIAAMAAHYVRTVKAFQPAGPYYLGGYCFGGVVAHEMARQLTAGADIVALVAILEGYAPSAAGQRNGRWTFAVNFVRTLPYWLRDYLQLGRIQMQARNRRLMRVARKRLLHLAGFATELSARDLLDAPLPRSPQLQKVLESHLAAARHYAPKPYTGRVVLFRTPQRLLRAPEHDMGWSRLATEPVDVQMIAGSHGTILQEPHVRVLAEKLSRFLGGDAIADVHAA